MRSVASPARALRRALLAGLALAAGCAVPGPPPGSEKVEPLRREVALIAGQNALDDDWEPNEDQILLGVDFAWRPPGAWVDVEAGFHVSWDNSDVDVGGTRFQADSSIYEFFLGVRRVFPIESLRLRPYLGAGASVLLADYESERNGSFVSDDEVALGGYAKAGLLVQLTADTSVGLEVRGLTAGDIEVEGADVDLDALQLAFVFSALF